MGLLFIFLLGIAAIILVARLASKARPQEERLLDRKEGGEAAFKNGGGKSHGEKPSQESLLVQEGLLSLLIKKGIITEEELLSEMKMIKKMKEEH